MLMGFLEQFDNRKRLRAAFLTIATFDTLVDAAPLGQIGSTVHEPVNKGVSCQHIVVIEAKYLRNRDAIRAGETILARSAADAVLRFIQRAYAVDKGAVIGG